MALKQVRMVVIGDEKVGKTSLILTAATEQFNPTPPPVLPPTHLPAEATPEGIPVVVTDTSSKEEDRAALNLACTQAHVVLLLFSTEKPQTLQRVSTFWVPHLRRIGVKVPVVLVGTKSDLRAQDVDLQQLVVPVMDSNHEVETCLECSAKKQAYVGEVFYYALKTVLQPTEPLFDRQSGHLKPRCVKALKRIFVMCDRDRDGALNDAELNAFQIRCFSAPLSPEELEGVKDVVVRGMPQGVDTNGLTLPGFLFLHALFIEKGRLETTWTVLREFGYSNEVMLTDAVLDSVNLTHAPDQVVELTEAGRAFFATCFARFDRNGDGFLSPSEQDEMFSTAPAHPWVDPPYNSVLSECTDVGITHQGFMAKWAYMTAVEPRRALSFALYLCFDGEPASLFTVSRPRHLERMRKAKEPHPQRSVYQCLVFGSPACGKTALLEGLAGQPAGARREGRPTPTAAVGEEEVGGRRTTLIMREVPTDAAERMLESPSCSDQLATADIAAFVFDSSSSESFHEAHALMLQVAQAAGDALPCLFVAAKDDLGMSQELIAECGEAVASLAIRMPIAVSMRVGSTSSVYSQLVSAAIKPELAIPLTPTLRAARQYRRTMKKAMLYIAAGTGTALAAYALWKLHKQRSEAAGAGREDGYGGSAKDGRQSPASEELKSRSYSLPDSWTSKAGGVMSEGVGGYVSRALGR